MQEPIRILIADSQLLFAEALGMALECETDIAVVNVFPTAGLKTEEVVGAEAPSVLLLDFWIRGMEAPVLIRRIVSANPKQKVILLFWFQRKSLVRAGLQAGAAASLSKGQTLQEVAATIRRVHKGERMLPFIRGLENQADVTIADWAGRGPGQKGEVPAPSLSPQEIRVLQLLAVGLTPKRIAERLSIKLPTLRTHTSNILRKTETHTLQEALAVAYRIGLLR